MLIRACRAHRPWPCTAPPPPPPRRHWFSLVGGAGGRGEEAGRRGAAQRDGRTQPLGSSLRPAPTASRALQAPATSSLPKKAASAQSPLPPPSCAAASLPPSRRPSCVSLAGSSSLCPLNMGAPRRSTGPCLSPFSTPPPGSLEPSPDARTSVTLQPPVQAASWASAGHPRGPSHSNIQHLTCLLFLSKALAKF